jgi:sugar phosphate permease
MATLATPERRRGARRGHWTTRRSLIAHVVLAVWIPGCIVAASWQVGVAESGNDLGWVYAVMWPGFAVFGTVFWWYLVHDDPETIGVRGLRRVQRESPVDDATRVLQDEALAQAEADDPELAAYNEYLAALADRGPGTWRRR